MDWKILLDLVVSGLLVATITYAIRLNNRLGALRKNRDDLAKIIVSFNEATVRAESSIPKLKRAAEEAGAGLQERVEKAQSLRDDIAFMIERADAMANRLENAVRSARTEVRSSAGPAAAPPPRVASSRAAQQATVAAAAAAAEDTESDERSEAERELLRALQSMR
jgi:cell division septum initiation protein DivIVA